MAFFDELGKKISQTSQGVVQKTKDATETLRLNGMISDEEKKINALFIEIGKKYYESHSESCEPMFAQSIEGIKEAQGKIASYSEQVKKLKGIVRCPNCGGEVSYNSQFCNSCGAPMGNTTIAAAYQNIKDRKSCPVCGAAVPSDKTFCTNCGSKMVTETTENVIPPAASAPAASTPAASTPAASAPAASTSVASAPAASTPAASTPAASTPAASAAANTVSSEFLCPDCGKQLSPNALFCSGCGRKMGGE